jgi:repressor of nif and glnA expression
MTLDILRESSEVLTSRQIAAELLRRKGLEPSVERIDQLQKSALNV